MRFTAALLTVLLCWLGAAANGGAVDLIAGPARALSGDRLVLGETTIHLFDIAAAAPDQSCMEWRGPRQVSYPCGVHAQAFLASLLADKTVTCVPRSPAADDPMIATCFVEGVDIGEALVAAGWAVACANSSRYVLREEAARAARKGIWIGNFKENRTCRDGGPPAD